MTTPEHSPQHSPADIRRALWENNSAPNGLLRNARAEELVAAAESTGDRDLLRQALFGLIKAYEFSSERGKMLVPFARLMREWDQDPSAFDSSDSHTFHWMFKWVSSGMLTLPEIPLATMEQWLTEMERRYRVAGYTERAVRQGEFDLADHTGDTERAARAFSAWTAADRDPMANCHACELNDQGAYWVRQGRDDKALDTWQPVLDGNSSCMEEPHRVLAQSLLPLVRTGRLDRARANHLRGYRMARGNDSLLPSVALHIEFCALTGNEGRGLELLSEHASHLASDGDPGQRLDLLGGTLVLLRRLMALGLGDGPAVAHGGRQRTVRELHDLLDAEAWAIAARFDERNGSDATSGRLRDRLDREPLVDALPLGVRAVRLGAGAGSSAAVSSAVTGAGAVTAAGARKAPAAASLPELVAEARDLRAQGHPRASAVWDRVEALVTETGAATDALLAADLLDQRALRAGRAGEDGARQLFERAVVAYRDAGEPGRAALAELRVASAAAQSGAEADEIRDLLGTAAASAEALDPADRTRTRRIATVALMRAKFEAILRDGEKERNADTEENGVSGENGESDDASRFDADLAAFVTEFAEASGEDDVDDLLAEAERLRADLAWRAGATERADALLASAARRCVDAGRPWDAAEPLARRARLLMALGRPGDAEDAARAALAHSAEIVAADELGPIRLTLAEVLYRQDGKEAEAADHALEAAHWFDAAGESAGAGAYARLVLAQALGETGRASEAAEVLESALPDLLEHGEEQAVRARDALARNLRALGDHRAAAEQYLLAAEVAKGWDHAGPHAHFASLGAECLSASGMRDEAVAAYHRAVELWQGLDDPGALARTLRALAWLEAGGGDTDAAKELMSRALAAVDGDAPELLLERARTWSQTAELLLDELYESEDDGEGEGESEEENEGGDGKGDDSRREVVRLLERADAAFAALGPDVLEERMRCVVRMAWTERALDRADEAAERIRALMTEARALDTDEGRSVVSHLERTLGHLTGSA